MATFRCRPLPGGHTPPAYSGSNVAGPTDWSVLDDASQNGDIIKLNISALHEAEEGYEIVHYDAAVSDANGNTTVHRVLGGPAVSFINRVQCDTAQNRQRVQLRSVQHKLNQIVWNDSGSQPHYTPVAGDTLSHANGATATVVAADTTTSGNSRYVVLTDLVGDWASGSGDVTINKLAGGTEAGVQGSILHCTHIEAQKQVITSEWSLPNDITPTAGTPTVTITASLPADGNGDIPCMQGQAVTFIADATGFQCTRPIHDLHYRFFVMKAGEQGTYASLPEAFEAAFGVGANNRCAGFTSEWAFAPRTTGTVTISCEVRDGSGNLATGSIDLVVTDPVSNFAEADIYAVSAASTAVPGAPGVTPHADLATAIAALPTFGDDDVLLLLDTGETHDMGDYSAINLKDVGYNGNVAIMPYNASGVGPDAAARATALHAVNSRSGSLTLFGLDLLGPYDPADPFSVATQWPNGLEIDLVGINRADTTLAHASVAECQVNGWYTNIILGNHAAVPGTKNAYVDVYSTDWFNFAIFCDDPGHHAMAGCWIPCNPKAWRKSGRVKPADDNATDGWFTDHGPYRTSRPRGSRGMSKCGFLSFTGWSSPTSIDQPPIRWYGNASVEPFPHNTHATELFCEGAGMTVDSTTRGGGDTSLWPQNFVIDKLVFLPTKQPLGVFGIGLGGTTLRNFLVVVDRNHNTIDGSGVRQILGTNNVANSLVPGQHDNENNPIIIEYGTVVDLRVDKGQNNKEMIPYEAHDTFPQNAVFYRSGTMLTYAPNFTLSDTAAEPVSRQGRWQPSFEGVYGWDELVNDPDPPTVAAQCPDLRFAMPYETTAAFEPRSGSSAYQSATGGQAYDDLRSTPRPAGTASRGAHEPTDQPYYTALPAFDKRGYVVGDDVIVTDGTAPGSTVAKSRLDLGETNKLGEMPAQTWNTTGESPGLITFETEATNASGTVKSGPITAPLVAAAPVITGVTPDAFANPRQGVTVTATDVVAGDRVYGIALLDGASAPSAQEVHDLRLDNGSVPLGILRSKWGNDLVIVWNIRDNGNDDGTYRLFVVIDNGVFSNVFDGGTIAVVA